MAVSKKIMVVLLIAFLASCQKYTTIEEYNVNTITIDYNVKTDHWSIGKDDESGDYFYYEFREPKLTQEIYDKGVMQAFLILRDGNISPLPFDDFWMDSDGYRWTEQVTCEFRPGYVTFILKYNDHAAVSPYYNYDFRVRFMW